MVRVLCLFLILAACSAEPPPTRVVAAAKSVVGDVPRPAVCQCSPEISDPEIGGCLDSDSDGDCVCLHEDNCPGQPNCDRVNTDNDAFGDACDELPNTPNGESVFAALDSRIDALEGAGTGAAITALQYDVAALAAALAEIRTKYPSHYHGLLGLNGDPVGSSGDLNYELPGDP